MTDSTWRVPLSDIVVDDDVIAVARDALASGWWSMGPRVEELERQFASFCGTSSAFAVSSGTAALHLALLAVGCEPGDEVVLPSLNFVAAANTVVRVGGTPVFCDVSGPDDLNLDPLDLERAVGPRCKAIVVLHYGGYPCDLDAVADVASRHGVAIVEDAAHAPGATWNGRQCGSIGRVGCFSFFSNKNLPVGEGGMVVTNDDDIAARVRMLRSHGMTTLTWERHRGHAASYDVVDAGLNYRMDEVRAAIARLQLERLGERNDARRRLTALYLARLHGVAGLSVPFADETARAASAHHLAVVLLPQATSRDRVRDALHADRIQTSVHYPPIHGFSFYGATATRALPRTDAVADRLLTLPLYPHLPEDDVHLVSDAVLRAVETSSDTRPFSIPA